MTTYLTGFELTDRISQLGLAMTNRQPTDPEFESSNQAQVSRAQSLLLAHGFTLIDAYGRANAYSTVFRAPGNEYPYYVELRYVHERLTPPFLALCYIDEGRFRQFRMPYRSFVVDLHGEEAGEMVQMFLLETADSGVPMPWFWTPILFGSPLVHY